MGNERRARVARGREDKLDDGGSGKGRRQRGKKMVDDGRARVLI